jgi:hypothetical protein
MKVERDIQGRPDQVIFRAATMLSAVGFELTERDSDRLLAEGPARLAVTQAPILAAGNLRVEHRDGRLSVETDLSGDRILYGFLALFPTLLMGGLNWALREDFAVGELVIWPLISVALLIWVRRQGRAAVMAFADRLAADLPD